MFNYVWQICWYKIGFKMIFRLRSSFWESLSPFRPIWSHFRTFFAILLKLTIPKFMSRHGNPSGTNLENRSLIVKHAFFRKLSASKFGAEPTGSNILGILFQKRLILYKWNPPPGRVDSYDTFPGNSLIESALFPIYRQLKLSPVWISCLGVYSMATFPGNVP